MSVTESRSGRVPHGRVVLVASAGAFLAFLDATIVNVAFPSIRESFRTASIGDLSWVLNAYNIVFAAFLVVCGRLSDLLGRRRAFVGGIALFTLASLACGAVGSVDLLVAARVVQALGAALLVPASLALVVEAAPAERRAHAIGLWGATAAVAAGLGPPVGGALVQAGGWRWAFFVNVPLGIAAVVAARATLVESRAPGRRRLPDLRGASLLAASLGLLNLAIVQGDDWGWTSTTTVAAFGGAALLAAGFALSSARARVPLLDPALLRVKGFGLANLATAVAGMGFFAYLLTNILWLQYVWGYGVLRAGLALMPGALVAAVVASVLGPVAARRGYRLVVVPGALVWACAYVWYHQRAGLTPDFLGAWLPGQVLSGIGVGATLPLLGSAALGAVPGGRFATASAVVSSARQLGGVIGVALLVVIVGTPTPQTIVTSLRHGWVLSIGAFCVVALLSLPLGKVVALTEESDDEDEPAVVSDPVPRRRVIDVDGRPAGVADVGLFAALPGTARRRLAGMSRTVHVRAGEVLLSEGDPADAVYVLQTGRLEVVIGGRPVRELGPGAVLGELAVLTGGRRSATVRARRDASLLEVTADDFSTVLRQDAAAGQAVATQLAERLADPAPARDAGPARPSVIAVAGLHAGAGEQDVAEVLAERLAAARRVVRLNGRDPDAVARAERDGALVLLTAGADDADRWRACVRGADLVVLVASAGTTPSAGWNRGLVLAAQPDLVLVGRTRPAPAVLSSWAQAVDAWQVTVADGSLAVALRPLADRAVGRSVGLALAGGGARGFAHIGVLRELAEAGIAVDRVTGASVGAIIAACWATGLSGEELDALCYREFVRRRPFSDYTLPTVSLARGRRTTAALQRGLGSDTVIEGLPRQFSCVSVDLAQRDRHVHRRGPIAAATRASASLPVLFPPVRDGDALLVDGGVLDNLPVDLLTERDEGPVVAVNISMGGSNRPRAGAHRAPRVPALGETLLRTMMIGSGGAVAAARERGAWVVTPPTLGVGLLEFSQLDRMVEAGRTAARALLERTGGDLSAPVDTAAVPLPRAARARRLPAAKG